MRKHACPEAKCSNPTIGFTLIRAQNPMRGNSSYLQASQEKDGRIIS